MLRYLVSIKIAGPEEVNSVKILVIIKTVDGTNRAKELEIPFAPYTGTMLNIRIGDVSYPLIVERLEWEEAINKTYAWIDGSNLKKAYYFRDSSFENDKTWKR